MYVYCIGHGQETDAEFHGCNQHEAAGVESDFIVHVGINKKKEAAVATAIISSVTGERRLNKNSDHQL